MLLGKRVHEDDYEDKVQHECTCIDRYMLSSFSII